MVQPLIASEDAARTENALVRVVALREPHARLTTAHSHAVGQLFGSADGLLSVELHRERLVVPATHAVWVPPRWVHAARSHGPYDGWSLYVAEAACGGLPPQPCILRTSALLRTVVERVASWPDPPRTPAQARLVHVALDEIRILPPEPLCLPLPRDPQLSRLADAVLADIADPRGHAAWAAWAGLPARTLSRRFSAETGLSFAAWRRRARAVRALDLLARGDSVTTVALDVGYENVSAFIAMFRRTMGFTPGRYGSVSNDGLQPRDEPGAPH